MTVCVRVCARARERARLGQHEEAVLGEQAAALGVAVEERRVRLHVLQCVCARA